MGTYKDYSVWSYDRDYCSDESGHSAEYKLGVRRHRLLDEAEEGRSRAKTIIKTNAKLPHDEQDPFNPMSQRYQN